MTTKLINIINFENFHAEVKDKKLPLKTLYKLSLLTKTYTEKLEFYQEQFRNIMLTHGEKDAEGNFVTVGTDGIRIKQGEEQECYTKLAELQNLEVEMPDVVFTIEEFDGIELTLEIFNFIMPFLKEE